MAGSRPAAREGAPLDRRREIGPGLAPCLSRSGATSATCPASMGCGRWPCWLSLPTTAFGWAPGGLLGVGVFFTLSGYLITDLLLGQWATRAG